MRPLGAWLRGPPQSLGGVPPPPLGDGDPALQSSQPPGRCPGRSCLRPPSSRWAAPASSSSAAASRDDRDQETQARAQDSEPVQLLPPAIAPQSRQPSDEGKFSEELDEAAEEKATTEGGGPGELAILAELAAGPVPDRKGSNEISDAAAAEVATQASEEADNSCGGQAELPPTASVNAAPHVPAALGEDLDAWLKDMKLEHVRPMVWRWCEEQGAATLEEVVEYSEELCSDLGLPLTVKHNLLRRGQAAMTRVCALSRKRRGSRPAPPSCVALQQPADDTLSLPAGLATSQPSSSSGSSRAGGSQNRMRGGSSVTSGASPGGEPSVTWSPRQKMNSENLDWPNVWLSTKERQGKKKKQERLQRKQLGCGGVGPADDAKDLQAAAKEKLELQFKEEQLRQRDTALVKLEKSLQSDQADELGSAIADMEQAGLGAHELVSKAKKRLELLVHNNQQKCAEAVLRLQFLGLEGKRDDSFGTEMREALKSAPEALQAEGGQKAVEEAQAALREWEEVCISLHMAMRSGRHEALSLALKEAKDASLPHHHSLVVEAQKTLAKTS